MTNTFEINLVNAIFGETVVERKTIISDAGIGYLHGVIAMLPYCQRAVILSRFKDNLSRDQVAKKLGISKRYEYESEAKVFRRLRNPIISSELRKYITWVECDVEKD